MARIIGVAIVDFTFRILAFTGHRMIVKFKDLPNMAPYCEHRSVYGMQLCGRPLAEHVLQSIANAFPELLVRIEDPRGLLDKDSINLSQFERVGREEPPSEPKEISGNTVYLTDNRILVLEYPWDLLTLLSHIVSRQQSYTSPDAIIEDGVDMRGNIHVEAGTRICRGAILQGDLYIGSNCMIGFNSIVRGPCSIGENCKIGSSVEIKNAIIANDTLIGPLCYVGDSIIGADSSLGALTRTSNFRLDRAAVSLFTNKGWIDTGRHKLGCFIGNNVQIAAGVITFPGTVIASNSYIGPQMLVDRNLESDKRYYVQQKVLTVSNTFFEK